MDALSIKTIADFCGGTLAQGDPDTVVNNVVTDSRSLKPGDLFLALRGDRFDGHQFVLASGESGAKGAIVDRKYDWRTSPADFAIVVVDETLIALQQLAASYRKTLSLKVIAITGSNGKTSTKDITARLVSHHYRVVKTQGNLNNHVGLPLSILQANSRDEVAVVEIGMNHPGEIAPLAAIASPDIAIITNVGTAHIEHMKTRDAIAKEKSVLAEAVKAGGHVILHAGDEYFDFIKARCVAQVTGVGVEKGDLRATNLCVERASTQFTLQEATDSVQVSLPILGEHMVVNALLAVGAARALGVSLVECASAMSGVQLSKGRLERKTKWGFEILDDSYNANPDSMSAAIRTLANMPTSGKRIAVLGRMGELGSHSHAGHWSVGQVAAEQNIDYVIGVGPEAGIIVESAVTANIAAASAVADVNEAAVLIHQMARPGDVILIKGSRSAAMEGTLLELGRLFESHSEIPVPA